MDNVFWIIVSYVVLKKLAENIFDIIFGNAVNTPIKHEDLK